VKALVKTRSEPGIWLEDQPEPSPGPNDVKIRVRKTAICGTDIHIYNWDEWARNTISIPSIIGHEFMGEVVELGSHVAGFSIGDRVSGEGHITCGYCRNCRAGKRHLCRNTIGIGVDRDGSCAEYLVLPASNAFRIDDSISDEIAACLDPLGNATHSALSFDLVGEDVLITGAGPIGLFATGIARFVGARNIAVSDVNDYRLDLARQMGATRTINVTHERIDEVFDDLGMTEGFDVALEMSGNPDAFRELLQVMNHGGRVGLLGIPPSPVEIDWNNVIFKGLNLKGIYGREMYETWYKTTAMLRSGLDVSPVITHRYSVEKFTEAFTVMATGKSGKVVLDWEEIA
jgi:threonine 3-dehydrogenase